MKHGNEQKKKHRILKMFLKIILVIAILVLLAGSILFAIKVAPNYINHDITDKTNLVINYSNVTGRMKNDLVIDENNVVYLSMNDIKNYYDKHIYYDKKYDQIVTTTDTKVAVLKLNENKITINGQERAIKGSAILKNDVYYLPISEMEDVYNIKTLRADNKVIIESLDRKLTTAKTNKKIEVKSKATFFSRTIEKLDVDEKVSIAEVEPNTLPQGWVKIRTKNGSLGYVEEKNLKDKKVERENAIVEKQIDEKISLAWEYFSEVAKAPDNTGIKYDGVNVVSPSFFYMKLEDTEKENLTTFDIVTQIKIRENVGDEGIAYIKWAHDNNYKVWPKVSNDTLPTTIDEFSYIINDYKLRDLMIKEILGYVETYNLDGINLDFEYMYKDDSEAFSRFVIELAPQLRAIGACLSVDVTAPNGGDNWSLCYNRNVIGEVADYIVFMGYDQYGTSKIGTTAGYNWLENSLKTFLGNEEVPSEKIILALPFYTKLWQTKKDETIKGIVITMNSVNETIPQSASKQWLEDLKQYYVQYEQGGFVYKMWIEDDESFTEKINLVNKYDLAGAGYWRKGFENESVWNIVKDSLQLK